MLARNGIYEICSENATSLQAMLRHDIRKGGNKKGISKTAMEGKIAIIVGIRGCSIHHLALDQSLGILSQNLQATASEAYDLTFAIFIVFVVRFYVPLSNVSDHTDDIIRFRNALEELFIFGLEQLEKRPDSNMLEGGIPAR